MARWVDPGNPNRNEWCPVNVDVLPTGDGIACGRFATVQMTDPDGEEMWICADCARTPILFEA